LDIETEIVREGRKIQLSSIRLLASGTEVVRASVLKTRKTDLPLPPEAGERRVEVPLPDTLTDAPSAGEPHRAVDARRQRNLSRARAGGDLVSRQSPYH
jgi:hypothetical protein